MEYGEIRAKHARIRQRRRRKMIARAAIGVVVLLVVIVAFFGVKSLINKDDSDDVKQVSSSNENDNNENDNIDNIHEEESDNLKDEDTIEEQAVSNEEPLFNISGIADAKKFPDSVVSTNGVLMEADTGVVVAAKDCDVRINPASMTKILTVLVAAENIEDLDNRLEDKVKITRQITDYTYSNGCSIAGFDVDEEVTVKDLFYGTILPSGADAALALAEYVAGSHDAFVALMNEKLIEIGIDETTHFTNCVGLYDEKHYSTVNDIAVIMHAAAQNEFCQQVLNARKYTTSVTLKHKEGILISNWFLRRIEDKDTHSEVLYAKTGYVAQSGSCAASYAKDTTGKEYILVTAGSASSWRCIYDQVDIYAKYLK